MRRFLTLLIIYLLLMGFDLSGWARPLRVIAERVTNPLKRKVYTRIKNYEFRINNWRSSPEELGKLRKRVRELERKAAVLKAENEQLKVDNQAMRKLLGAPLPMDWDFLPAKVLGKTRYLMIDQGRRDGVEVGMVAIFEKVFVGRVIEVSEQMAKIVLPYDFDSQIKVKTETARGVLVGDGKNLFLDQVLQKQTLLENSLVVTSGEEEIFPADLLIGKIKTIEKEERQPYQKATVEPLVDYRQLERVFLILN